jgi:hypothetical protein
MKLNDLETVEIDAARRAPEFRFAPGGRGAIAALMTGLVQVWIGLYAAPPRRPLPPL